MFDPDQIPETTLDAVGTVVEALTHAVEIETSDVMLVGAFCRDAIHAALGHEFATRATRDLDLALALRSWPVYASIAASFPQVGNSGICFRIAGLDVDLLPFGDMEDPAGVAEPPSRGGPMSAWALEEIHSASLPLAVSDGQAITIPTVAGYCAAKLGAWLDRSEWGEFKDASDLALILYWYAESSAVQDRLYDTDEGRAILTDTDFDLTAASARLLGKDIAALIGAERQAELVARWPGDLAILTRNLRTTLSAGGAPWPSTERRDTLIRALTHGIDAGA